jgi:hypothetical protein
MMITAIMPGEPEGDNARDQGQQIPKEISNALFGGEKEEAPVAKRTGGRPMSEHADIVLVNYPRGVTAIVWFDLETGAIATSHPGLRDTLRRGCRNWSGRLVFPCDGPPFLSAVYDHFFLSGYTVHWVSLSGFTLAQKETYRV